MKSECTGEPQAKADLAARRPPPLRTSGGNHGISLRHSWQRFTQTFSGVLRAANETSNLEPARKEEATGFDKQVHLTFKLKPSCLDEVEGTKRVTW